MADERDQATAYLQRLDADNEALRAQLEQAVSAAALAEIRAVGAEARASTADAHAHECEVREEAAETKAAAATLDAGVQRARADALDGSMAAERLARIEADKRCTAMMAEVKKPPPPTPAPPVALALVKPAPNAGYDVTIHRDGADNMRSLSIVPRAG